MTRARCRQLLSKYYSPEDHPFNIFERKISSSLHPSFTLVDAGCGAEAPLLASFIGKARRLIGIDLVDFHPALRSSELILFNQDLSAITLNSSSVDIVVSRSVLEHVQDPEAVYREMNRILKPGGKFMFLVPNFWDYVSLASYLIPNSFHERIVSKLTGRAPEDTFPTYYRSNTRKKIVALAGNSGFQVNSIDYYGQYPYMLEFNSLLFRLGILYDKTTARIPCLKYLRGWILAELTKER